ncbi:MAG: DUF5995 family protein [Bacteroidia bacterium]|nr:DUF5995 family protein [Bacteroidia bacterium]
MTRQQDSPILAAQAERTLVYEMDRQLAAWTADADRKAVFLGCYTMMTKNMYAAVAREEFMDAAWVRRLLERFAHYYFDALRVYVNNPDQALHVWRMAHDAARTPSVTPVQLLFLGVNAHINYDLVLAVEELLAPDWRELHGAQREARFDDYSQVNAIIARTIDAVQDDVLSPAMPSLGVVDALMGRLDELLISTLLTRWRDDVWQWSLKLLDAGAGPKRDALLCDLDAHVIGRAEVLLSPDWRNFHRLF